MSVRTLVVAAASLAAVARAQQYQNGVYYPGTDWSQTDDPSIVPTPDYQNATHTRLLTPDGYWHNRYQ